MPTLEGAEGHAMAPCRWCGRPTDLTFAPEGGSQVGPIPLHMLCGAAFIRAYRRLAAGEVLSDRDAGRVRRLTDHAATSASSNVRSPRHDLQ